jgi:hypothetical protein
MFEEGAKAVTAASGAVAKVVDGASAILRAPVVQAAIGLYGGDYLIEARERNRAKLKARTEEILNARNVVPELVSPSIGIPLIEGAENEDREELREIWARLLAAAMDPARSKLMRLRFIETAKRLAPLDAALIRRVFETKATEQFETLRLGADFQKSNDEIVVSIDNLVDLGCLVRNPTQLTLANITPYGREFVRACSD